MIAPPHLQEPLHNAPRLLGDVLHPVGELRRRSLAEVLDRPHLDADEPDPGGQGDVEAATEREGIGKVHAIRDKIPRGAGKIRLREQNDRAERPCCGESRPDARIRGRHAARPGFRTPGRCPGVQESGTGQRVEREGLGPHTYDGLPASRHQEGPLILLRYFRGGTLSSAANVLVKWLWSKNPHSEAMTAMLRSVLCNRYFA